MTGSGSGNYRKFWLPIMENYITIGSQNPESALLVTKGSKEYISELGTFNAGDIVWK